MTLDRNGLPVFTDHERDEVSRLLVLRHYLREAAIDHEATLVFLVPKSFLPGVVTIYGVRLVRMHIEQAMVGLEPMRPKVAVSGRVLTRNERGPRPGFDDQRERTHDDD